MVPRANEANRTVPKTSLPVPANLGRAFPATERFASPLEIGAYKVDLVDVLASSRMADADVNDAENIVRRRTC